MGFVKDLQMEQAELGYSAPLGAAVCDECVCDYALIELIREQAYSESCDFCGREAEMPIAASTEDVLQRIGESLKREWESPEDAALFWDKEDGRWAGASPVDTFDAINESGDWPFVTRAFEEFVQTAFADAAWVPRDPFALSEGEALAYSWQLFRQTVMHETRFLFALLEHDASYDDPGHPVRRGAEMLKELGRLIIEHQLFDEISSEQELYRIRVHDSDKEPASAQDLGTPRSEQARQSRMSPAGIAMLYLADGEETAFAETVDPARAEGKVATVARFRSRQPARVVDLAKLEDVPSIFDADETRLTLRPPLGFLHGFRRDLSAEIDRGDRIHIEYVPTQVVCEYLRRVFRDADGRPVDGLAFDSARHRGGRNVVLFIDREHCLEAGEEFAPFFGAASSDELTIELLGFERRALHAAGESG